MMWKKVFALCGLILFLGGLAGILTLMHLVASDTGKALALDRSPVPGFGPCPIIKLNAQLATRVMSDGDTQALTVTVINYCPGSQTVTVNLNAPEVNFSPSESARTFTVGGSTSTSVDWILIPNKLGTFAISVSFDGYDTVTLGITVVNVFGLRLWQTQFLSGIATFFGPVVTFAWWYDRWKERKKRKSEEARLAGTTAKSAKSNKRAKRRHGR